MLYLLFSDDRLTISTLQRHLRSKHQICESDFRVYPHVTSQRVYDQRSNNVPTMFAQACSWINEQLGMELKRSRETVALVSHVDFNPQKMVFLEHTPTGNSAYTRMTHQVFGKLVMAYPEITWIFADEFDSHDATLDKVRKRISPLFDVDGKREQILTACREYKKDNPVLIQQGGHLPERPRFAVVIDEEDSYAYFNSYVCYQTWCRVAQVTTMGGYRYIHEDLVRRPGYAAGTDRGVFLSLEDVYVHFPDRESFVTMSDIKERDDNFPHFTETKNRAFATVGGSERAYPGVWEKNKKYIEDNNWRLVYKPFSGLFDLQNRISTEYPGFRKAPPDNPQEDKGLDTKQHPECRIRSNTLAWFWQWRREVFGESKDEAPEPKNQGPHSAPGSLLAIAEQLLQRCRRAKKNLRSVEDAIQGAVLAMTAQELLGGLTPTLSLEAIALKHYFEVYAECQFLGADSNINVKDRLAAIEQEVCEVAKAFDPARRKFVHLDGQSNIVNTVTGVFRSFGQFDEEQECLIRARELNRKKKWEDGNRWEKAKGVFGQGLVWYINQLMKMGPGRFTLYLIANAALFWGAFWLLGCDPWTALNDSFGIFWGIQPPDFGHLSDPILTCFSLETNLKIAYGVSAFGMMWGFLHLGVFISHLYTVVSRR
jgi:hypothetical protein